MDALHTAAKCTVN